MNLLGDTLGKLAPGALDAPLAPYGAGPRKLGAHPPGHNGREMGMARPSHTELNDLSFDMNFDPQAAQRIRDIAAAKDRAVRAEVRTQKTCCSLGIVFVGLCTAFSTGGYSPVRHDIYVRQRQNTRLSSVGCACIVQVTSGKRSVNATNVYSV